MTLAVIQPALLPSVFAQVATTVRNGSHNYRTPIVSADPTAAWVAEGAEISPSDPTLQEPVVTPPKVAGLTIITRELADCFQPGRRPGGRRRARPRHRPAHRSGRFRRAGVAWHRQV
jgi:hypothetical protein